MMTTTLEQPQLATEPKTIEKVAIVISKGSLEGIYPGLIMANGARMDGIEADLFFTFFGLDAIRNDRYEKIKVATVGNPGLHMPTWLGALPGFSALATKMMKRQMEKIDMPPIPSSSSSSPTPACTSTPARRASTCSASPWRTSPPTSRRSSASASSTRKLPTARSSSPRAARTPVDALATAGRGFLVHQPSLFPCRLSPVRHQQRGTVARVVGSRARAYQTVPCFTS